MSTPALTAIFLTLALFIALLGLIAAASRHKKKALGALHLVGRIGRVEADLQPEGAVIVAGELWRARLSNEAQPLRRGTLARVVGANGHLLEVEPAEKLGE
jgi:membrane protein implicated in regulation of membrane protease activity